MTSSPAFTCHLHHRAVVSIGGPDRRSFLQGLISNDIELARLGRAIYAALLTPQGKFLHDLFIVEHGDDFLVDCEAGRADDLVKRLTAYKLRAKVTIRDMAGDWDIWATTNSNPVSDAVVYADPRLPDLGVRLMVKKGVLMEDATDMSGYDQCRMTLGVADGSRDLVIEKSTLSDGNIDLLNGVSWNKGCYVGQELTARMHYRALVKKRMLPVKINGVAPACGEPIKYKGHDVGDMRSSSGDIGLALLNLEQTAVAIEAGEALSCGKAELRPYLPEWMKKVG